MAGYLTGKVALVIGEGDDTHRGVVVAMAEAGADVAIAGVTSDLSAEAALHSISNEIWALNRRSAVVTMAADDEASLAGALDNAQQELGSADLVVRCEAVPG